MLNTYNIYAITGYLRQVNLRLLNSDSLIPQSNTMLPQTG